MDTQNKINISDAEWKIMQILWKHSSADNGISLGDIRKNLDQNCKWSMNTVRTLLVRLMEKQAADADKTTGVYKYFPLLSEEECVRHETKSFLSKAFGGSSSLLFASLIKNGEISAEEKEEILSLIGQMKGDESNE